MRCAARSCRRPGMLTFITISGLYRKDMIRLWMRGHEYFPGREAAAHDCAGSCQRSEDPDPGWGDQFGRYAAGKTSSERDGCGHEGKNELCDRASAFDHCQRRSHFGDAAWRYRGKRHARRASAKKWRVCQVVQCTVCGYGMNGARVLSRALFCEHRSIFK